MPAGRELGRRRDTPSVCRNGKGRLGLYGEPLPLRGLQLHKGSASRHDKKQVWKDCEYDFGCRKDWRALLAAYSAAKGGVVAFQKALAKEVGRHNINVNGVSAGATDTERILQSREKTKTKLGEEEYGKRQEAMLKAYPMRRFGETVDLARMCVFLSSDVSKHITGQTISVSGGFSMAS